MCVLYVSDCNLEQDEYLVHSTSGDYYRMNNSMLCVINIDFIVLSYPLVALLQLVRTGVVVIFSHKTEKLVTNTLRSPPQLDLDPSKKDVIWS